MTTILYPAPTRYYDPTHQVWSASHDTEYATLHAGVDEDEDGTWSSLCIQHDIGTEVMVSMSRDDWHALATLCEQATRSMDKLEEGINGR